MNFKTIVSHSIEGESMSVNTFYPPAEADREISYLEDSDLMFIESLEGLSLRERKQLMAMSFCNKLDSYIHEVGNMTSYMFENRLYISEEETYEELSELVLEFQKKVRDLSLRYINERFDFKEKVEESSLQDKEL